MNSIIWEYCDLLTTPPLATPMRENIDSVKCILCTQLCWILLWQSSSPYLSEAQHPLCLPIMLYGSELWYISKTDLLFLEQVHRKIFRTIQGLPISYPSSFLSTLLGVQSIDASIQQRSLGFIVAILPIYLWTRILVARAASNPKKGVVKRYREILAKHNLTSLLSTTPSSSVWRSYMYVKKHLSTGCVVSWEMAR